MARLARIVVRDLPHHVIQRGARRMQVFFCHGDYRAYVRILARQASKHGLDVWAYCLMPNHVHLIAVPSTEHALARALGEAHRRYALRVNKRKGWTGHLWQERFSSFAMDGPRLPSAIRYILLNPVRAGLATTATDWPYSSARAQIAGAPDELVGIGPTANLVSDWRSFLSRDVKPEELEQLRWQGRSGRGRPLGSVAFIDELERITGRCLRRPTRGRKPACRQ
ncbi:MAG TPA: transposase [Thermoanaerobaculia bacterium]|jgi:putative transposase|nr:transposase [Thermoanaerobaculia bacterium]